MRPEIIPDLLKFSVQTWTYVFYGVAVAMGIYNAVLTYLREGKTDKARGQAITQGVIWAVGGIVVTNFLAIPRLVIPGSAPDPKLPPTADHLTYLYNLPLHTYGFAIALGFMLAIQLSAREAERSGIFPGETPPMNDEQRLHGKNAVLDLAFWVLLSAIVGSRLYYIAVNWTHDGYDSDPMKIFKFWEGGLVFYGGFLGAVGTSIFYARKHKILFLKLADLAIPTVSLGQFFGRLGCLSAGCCYGKEIPPTGPTWMGLHFPRGSLAWDSLANQRHLIDPTTLHTPGLYPSQLVDGFGQLLIFLFLTFILKPNKRYDGQILLTWLVLYPLLRFSDEFLRGDTERGVYTSLQVSVGQLTSLALMCVALGLLIYTHRRKTAGGETPQNPEPAAA